MLSVIPSPRERHHVRTPEDYRRKHKAAVGRRVSRGARLRVHEVEAPKVARVDWENGWIIDCECGAGNCTDPEWSFACCFGCGAVHTVIRFPRARRTIERLLLARPKQLNRAWEPGETVGDVRAVNRAHGVGDDLD